MLVPLSNIAKGVIGKLNRQSSQNRFPSISWWNEKILKHQEDQNLKTIHFGKLIISYKRPYEVLHTYRELFEDEIYSFTSNSAKPFIIDCGANIGLSVLYFKTIYPEAELIAFEPDKDNYELLQKNISLNNLPNVKAQQAAVWNKTEILHFSSNGSQASHIVNDGKSFQKTIDVQAIRLADILKEREVDLLKIDVEGVEDVLIKDCVPYLSNVKCLFVEYHGKVNETQKLINLLNDLKSANFNVYIKMAADNLTHPFISKQTNGAFDVQLNIFCYR